MRLLRLICFVSVCIVWAQILFADELTPEQRSFRSNIMQFLKEEGFSPTIDEEDNSVNFKKEGESHWITIEDSNPFYLEFHRSGLKLNDADKSVVIAAVNEGNRTTRCAKAMINESIVTYDIEMYCHSAEEFRYVFYQCLNALEVMEKKITDYYNEHSGTSSTHVSGSSAISKFFPVYGFMLGQVTTNDFKRKGYNVETISSGSHNCDVKGLTFWDHNKDNVFEHIYMTQSDYMPDMWEENVGLSWKLSYNQLLNLFRRNGFSIQIKESPSTKKYSGRKTLSAEVRAVSSDGRLVFDLDFDYGNSHGEGYSQDSPNSLYSISIDIK